MTFLAPFAVLRRRAAAALATVVLGVVVACSGTVKPAGGLELVIATDLRIPDAFDAIHLEIRQQVEDGGFMPAVVDADFPMTSQSALPTTYAIVAGASPDQVTLIDVAAKHGDRTVVSREALIQVPTDRVARLLMMLSARCVDVVCLEGDTCNPDTGRCESNVVDTNTLPPYTPGEPIDAGALVDVTIPGAEDGGGDGPLPGADAGSDAGHDAAVPGPDGGTESGIDAGADGGQADGGPGDASVSAGDAQPAEASACTGLLCNGACVPSDVHHCGACGNDCTALPHVAASGLSCTAGRCAYACAPGYDDCAHTGKGCADDLSQNGNCGACGVTCSAPTGLCSGAGCTSSCSGATPTLCGTTCTDTQTDSSNCGGCGAQYACSGGKQCATGACQCPAGTRLCGATCAANDTNACGPSCTVCSTPPGGSVSCDGTSCIPSCPAGQHTCNGACYANTDPPSNTSDPCVVDEAYGVFVSPSGSNATGDGTRAKPYADVDTGLVMAARGAKRVYACGGSYPGNLSVSAAYNGFSVYGGLNCSTWAYDGSKATLTPTSGDAMIVDTASNLTFEDITFNGALNHGAGASSMGVLVTGSTNIVFRRCTITAAAGQPGQDQTQSASFSSAAPAGNPAPEAGPPGNAQPNPLCSAANMGAGTGGAGGTYPGQTSGCGTTSGCDGLPGPPTNPSNGSKCPSGVPCGFSNSSGQAGGPGVDGASGQPGAGAKSWGTLTSQGWTPSAGQPGSPGGIGQGGGGAAYWRGTEVDVAGPGGGAGGCGGQGGAGGGGGGSSIGVLIFESTVDLEACTISASAGARGGNGAQGEVGQLGGSGGAHVETNDALGGQGGNGGDGGPGGGGAGGLSAGIVFVGAVPVLNGTTINIAGSGSGGADGSNGPNSGKPGVAQRVVQLQ